MSSPDSRAVQASIEASSQVSLWDVFAARVQANPHALAVTEGQHSLSYLDLARRSIGWEKYLKSQGILVGDRIGLLARNCSEYLELELAAARCGAIIAALNWRLADAELRHCINLVSPSIVIAQETLANTVERLGIERLAVARLEGLSANLPMPDADIELYADHSPPGETPLVILYTSGTTGMPKGAVISHRAMIARSAAFTSDLALEHDDGFVAWAPFFHMASTDHSLSTLLRGGTVHVVDGYQPDRLVELLETQKIGWFVLMPGMVGEFAQYCDEKGGVRVQQTRVCGAMADLVPAEQIAHVTRTLGVPYLNSFGATETGLPPGSGSLIEPGIAPTSLPKRQSAFCQLRLVDPHDHDVPDGEPGEVALRGPTLFSGYWQADETNAHDFRNGWFHMGDVMRRNPDGTIDYVDRVKYLIKSGGENIYPAEIEMVVSRHPAVSEAVAVRQVDPRWGEVPVLLVVPEKPDLKADEVMSFCQAHLSGYKCPKQVLIIKGSDLPRSTTGKVQRHLLEAKLTELYGRPTE